MDAWREALRLVDAQHGVAARPQLLGLGLTDAQIKGHRRRGELLDIHRGVYRIAGAPETLEQRALAACLACGPSAVASHHTAAALHGLLSHRGPLHVTLPSPLAPRTAGLRIHRTRHLPCADVRVRRAVPLTVVERTIVDLATASTTQVLEDVLDTALRERLTTPDRVLERLPGLDRRRNAGMLRELLHDRLGHPRASSSVGPWRSSAGTGSRSPSASTSRSSEGALSASIWPTPSSAWQSSSTDALRTGGPTAIGPTSTGNNAAVLGGWHILYFTWQDITERPGWVAITIAEALGLAPARWARAR